MVMLTEGGFGIVYRAEHEDWGTVAYKELKANIIKPESRSVVSRLTLIRRELVKLKENATLKNIWLKMNIYV